MTVISEGTLVSVLTQKFCDNADYILVYVLENKIVAFGFRSSITEPEKIEFLGMRRLTRKSQETDE